VGGSGMPEEVRVKVFINGEVVGSSAKDILQGSG